MLDSKQGRVAPWASVIITSFTIVTGFFIFLALRSPLPAQESTILLIDNSRDSFIPSEEERDKTMESNMERLILEQNMAKFQAEGFTCQTEQNSHQCITSNPVRIVSNSDQITIYVPSSSPSGSKPSGFKTPQNITIKPYAQTALVYAMQMVSPLQILEGSLEDTTLPACQYIHPVPAVVFSSGGYLANMYHSTDELLIPLFLTTQHFNSNIQFFVSDYDHRVMIKNHRFLRKLSKFEPIDAAYKNGTHCFPGAVIGLNYHGNIAVNSSDIPTGYTMDDFRRFMHQTYDLNPLAMELNTPVISSDKRPLLVLLSRTRTRAILNMNQVVKLIEEVGYQVHVALDSEMSNFEQFSRVLSKCSVLMGVHGAGLTNMVFIPRVAVMLQVVPLGLKWAGIFCYVDTATKMGLRSVDYMVEPKESSLSELYGPDDPVLVDPVSEMTKRPVEARVLYVDKQNVTINLNRFRETLLEVLHVIRSPVQNTTQVLDQN